MLLDSVAPEVKMISFGDEAWMRFAICSRAFSMADSVSQP